MTVTSRAAASRCSQAKVGEVSPRMIAQSWVRLTPARSAARVSVTRLRRAADRICLVSAR